MTKVQVWLDDERPIPSDYDVHVRTAEEAIALLKSGRVSRISLDHDLGQEKTGYDVAKWIEENAMKGTLRKLNVRVHTQNPVGNQNILAAIKNAQRYWGQSVEDEIVEVVLTKLAFVPKVGDLLEKMPDAEYTKLEDDLTVIVKRILNKEESWSVIHDIYKEHEHK